MRQVIDPQLKLGEQDISQIQLDVRSRDDIPRLLRGLQYIYVTPQVRERVFAILAEVLPPREDGTEKVSADTGRPGMEQWKILVLGVLRLGLNADYDRVHELANQHNTIRQMLGHGDWSDETQYGLQQIAENLRLLTPEILERINAEVVAAGHSLVKKGPDDGLAVRSDSFVLKTDVHFPTDINVLLDAVRKAIETCARLCREAQLSDWRQSAYNIRCLKKAHRRIQQLKRSRSKDAAKRQAREEDIEQAYRDYLEMADELLARARETRAMLHIAHDLPDILLLSLDGYIAHAERQIDQTDRRVLRGERIPHDEKVFSIFQPHTEWIVKGKAGVPVELGLRVAVSEDQYGFILNHRVMEKCTDDQIAIPLVEDLCARFPEVKSVSMDKGFHSPANQKRLAEIVDLPVVPKKGKCSAAEAEREHDPEFIRLRRRHSGVESAINALEAHGLDICRDHGIDGFKRYVALAVVGSNLHRLGAILLKQEAAQEAEQERRRRKRAA
jgi:IS5 family transposase